MLTDFGNFMSKIDHTFYINLDIREDRRLHVENNVLPFIGIPMENISSFPAKGTPKYFQLPG